jgi:hypothetical protein
VIGITEQDGAEACGVYLRTYRRYEAGHCEKSMPLVRFARKYGVSMKWLLEGDAERIGEHLPKGAKGKVIILSAN